MITPVMTPSSLAGTDRNGEVGSATTSRESLLEPRLVTVSDGPQTDSEPHRFSRWAAAKRAARRSPKPSLTRHRSYGNRLVAANRSALCLDAPALTRLGVGSDQGGRLPTEVRDGTQRPRWV